MFFFKKLLLLARHALLRIGTHHGASYKRNINVGYGMFFTGMYVLKFYLLARALSYS